jgi:hypothetical protein
VSSTSSGLAYSEQGGRGAVREHRAALADRREGEGMDDPAHARRPRRAEDLLEQRDLVCGELRGVGTADVAVLVVAEERVHAAGILRGQPGVGDHHLAGRIAVVLTQEVRPVLGVDVRAMDQVAREQHVRVAVVLQQGLLEDIHEPLEVAHAALEIRAYEEPTVVG